MRNREEDEAIEHIDFKRSLDRSLKHTRRRLQAILDDLTPKEREILRKRFGKGPDGHTP